MRKFSVIECNSTRIIAPEDIIPSPHHAILETLFKEKNKVHRLFSDIKGICFIDHFAIKSFNKAGKFLIFSLTPSVEYNLIINNLWQYDGNFSPITEENKIRVWEDFYIEPYKGDLKRIKEVNHHFKFCFDIGQVKDTIRTTFSFATRSILENPKLYYEEKINEILTISSYTHEMLMPLIHLYMNKNPNLSKNVKLLVNNTRGFNES